MIELQGDLSVDDGTGLPKKLMGDLHFTKEVSLEKKQKKINKSLDGFLFDFKGTPLLILGHHVLYGKVVNLDKPLVLLKKNLVKNRALIDSDDEKIDDQEDDKRVKDNTESKTSTEYLISAVIKKKFLFNKRPRPIVYLDSK